MAVVDIATMKRLFAEIDRVSILAELDARRRKQDETRIRKIRKGLLETIPKDIGGGDKKKDWAKLGPEEQEELFREARKTLEVLRQIANPGPCKPHIMASGYPCHGTVLFTLAVFALLTFGLLFLLWRGWDDMTYSCRAERKALETAQQTEKNAREEAARLKLEGGRASNRAIQLSEEFEARQEQAGVLARTIDAADNRASRAAAAIEMAKQRKAQNIRAARDSIRRAREEIELGEGQLPSILQGLKGPAREDRADDATPLEPTVVAPTVPPEPPADAAEAAPEGEPPANEAPPDVQAAPPSDGADDDARQAAMDRLVVSAEESLTSLRSRIEVLKKWAEEDADRLAAAKEGWQSARKQSQNLLARAERLEKDAGAAAVAVSRAKAAIDEDDKCPPAERAVVLAVMLIGALGGCLRLIASLVSYIGNRELRKSWLPHYWLMPLQGAALATIVYFVIRAGVLSGTVVESSDIQKLNLFNIYLYAGLSGMFAKNVTDWLQQLLTTVFPPKKTERDKLGETSTDSQTVDNK